MGVYYTTFSKKQAYVIEKANAEGNIDLTPGMIDYVRSIAERGGGFARDKQEEEFRQRLHEAVGLIFRGEYQESQKTILQAFKVIMTGQTSDALQKIKKELEN